MNIRLIYPYDGGKPCPKCGAEADWQTDFDGRMTRVRCHGMCRRYTIPYADACDGIAALTEAAARLRCTLTEFPVGTDANDSRRCWWREEVPTEHRE